MPDTEQQQAEELYQKLKPEAVAVYVDHIVSRTPPQLQDEMKTIAAGDMAPDEPDPDPTVASVSNGQAVTVNDSLGAPAAGSPGTAVVSGSTLTSVSLGPVAQRAQGATGQSQSSRVTTGTVNPRR